MCKEESLEGRDAEGSPGPPDDIFFLEQQKKNMTSGRPEKEAPANVAPMKEPAHQNSLSL